MLLNGSYGRISVSDVRYSIKIFNSRAVFNLMLNFVNRSKDNGELEYKIPFNFFNEEVFLSATYQNRNKRAKINLSEQNSIVKFDDGVASNNFSIGLFQKDENALSLLLVNFHQNTKAKIVIQGEFSFFKQKNFFYFTIPLIEKYDNFMYPNYSVVIEFLNQYIFDMKDIHLEYNRSNQTHNINDKSKISVSNVSFESPFILKIGKKIKTRPNHTSLRMPKDIIFFIDSQLTASQKLMGRILDFINCYGTHFQFNIIKYGQNSGLLSTNMINKNDTTMKSAEEFLKNNTKTNINKSFVSFYTDIFGYDIQLQKNQQQMEIKKDSQKMQIKKVQKIRINNLNRFNTVVICIGSISSDYIIPTRKVETYLVDPIQKYDTYSFSLKNKFNYIGPLTHDIASFSNALDYIMQELRSGENIETADLDEYEKNNQEFYNKIDQLENNQCFDDLKEFVFSNGLNINMNLEKIRFLTEKVVVTDEDIVNFLCEKNLNQITLMDLDENKQLMDCIVFLMIIKTYGRFVEKCFTDTFNENMNILEILKSIEKEQFIVFDEDEVSDCVNNQYISMNQICKNKEIDIKQFEDQISSQNESNDNDNKSSVLIHDDQFCQPINVGKEKYVPSLVPKKQNELMLNNECSNFKKLNHEKKRVNTTSDSDYLNKVMNSFDFSPKVDFTFIDSQLTIKYSS